MLIVALTMIVIIAPIGFIGGGWDDWQYLNAARCWQSFGPCLPQDHWQGRWPIVAPMAALFALMGESRTTVALWPLTASIACLGLVVAIGNRQFGRPVGWLAALLLLVTPAFSIQLLTPSAEAVELALLLAGAWGTLVWEERRTTGWAIVAGLMFGLALQVRETAIVFVAVAAVYVAIRKPSVANLVAASAAFLAPLVIEALVYWNWAGDPLWRRRLSVAHTQILSSELKGTVGPSGPPFFSAQLIANWRHEPGVRIHWLIDGIVNLFVNAKAGLAFLFVPVLLLIFRQNVESVTVRTTSKLWALAVGYACILIYVFAIDPKARMMFVPITAISLALALVTISLWLSGRRLVTAVAWSVCAIAGMSLLAVHQRTDIVEDDAREWIRALPGQIEVDPNTKRHLALVPEAEALPLLESNRPYLMYNTANGCEAWLRSARFKQSATLVDLEFHSRAGHLSPETSGALCLFRYDRNLSAQEVRSAIQRSRVDGRMIMTPRRIFSSIP